jgi:Flp pilus assembly pilin Flp
MAKASIIRLLGDESGTASIEYALVAVLVGIAAIAALETLGSAVTGSLSNTNDSLVDAIDSLKSN